MMITHFVKVDWDLEMDGKIYTMEEAHVSEIVYIPDEVLEEADNEDLNEAVCDYLSETYGWIVNDWSFVSVNPNQEQ